MRQYFIISSRTFEIRVITIHSSDYKGKKKPVDSLDLSHCVK